MSKAAFLAFSSGSEPICIGAVTSTRNSFYDKWLAGRNNYKVALAFFPEQWELDQHRSAPAVAVDQAQSDVASRSLKSAASARCQLGVGLA